MIRRGAIVAIGVVVMANLWAIVGVVRDRSGEPDASVTLDERELALVAPEGDTSAVLLRLRYQGAPRPGDVPRSPGEDSQDASVLDQARLEALGFDCSVSPANADAPDRYRRALPRPALIVFAIGGPEWERRVSEWQARRLRQIETEVAGGALTGDAERQARAEVASLPGRVSRLWVMDAGRDLEALRVKYPDRSRTLILRGVVELHLGEAAPGATPVLHGHVSLVSPFAISVPAALAGPLERLRGGSSPGRPVGWGPGILPHDPRYEVRLAVGRALQPWVVAVRPTGRPD